MKSRSALPAPRSDSGRGAGGPGAPVDEVELGVVAAHHPRRGVPPGGAGQAAPGVAAELVRGGRGVDAPQLLAGVDVVGADEAPAGARARRVAARAVDDLAVHDGRPRRLRHPLAVVGPLGLPHELAGAGVEGDDEGVVGGEEDLVAVDRDVAVAVAGAGDVGDVLGQVAAVLPQEVAGGRIEGLHDVLDVGEEHHPVVDDRLDLLIAELHGARPDEPQLGHVAGVDLVEGAVAPQRVAVAEADPVLGRGLAQHRVGDGHEVLQQLRHRRRCRLRRGAGGEREQTDTGQESAPQGGPDAGRVGWAGSGAAGRRIPGEADGRRRAGHHGSTFHNLERFGSSAIGPRII